MAAAPSYRSWLLCVLAAYLTLVFMFHSQLPLFTEERRKQPQSTNRGGHRIRLLLKTEPQLNGTNAAGRHHDNGLHNISGFNLEEDEARRPKQPRRSSVKFPMHEGCRVGDWNQSVGFVGLGNSHFVYSAYLDDRQESGGEAHVRIIALLRNGEKARYSCRLEINGTQQVHVRATLYEMCENHAKDFGGWIISCKLPKATPPPCQVTLVHSTAVESQKTTLPVFMTSSPNPPSDFGVCVSPLFGHIPSTTLVEFIELTLLLGAAHFTFYLHEASLEMRRVLDYYEQQGVVSVLPWNLPVPTRAVWYHGQLLAINDCLYRSMHAMSLVAFNDIDEFIVPQRHSNWSSLVQHLL